MTIRSVSYGGGVQSTALLVLAAQRRIDYPLFIMANVGDDSEHPDTLQYVDEIAKPYAAEHGIELVIVQRQRRGGETTTLLKKAVRLISCPDCRGSGDVIDDPAATPCERCSGTGRAQSRSIPIPLRMSNGAPGNRSCTAEFKIATVAKELKRRGATVDDPAVVGIGISLDEIARANRRSTIPHERVVYPLVGIGEETGLKLRRDDCSRIIRGAGIPVPPKSSCYFCPFHRPDAWEDLAREHPDLFERSALLEDVMNERRDMLGKDHVYLTRFGIPLREAINAGQQLLPLADDTDGSCDSGWCFT